MWQLQQGVMGASAKKGQERREGCRASTLPWWPCLSGVSSDQPTSLCLWHQQGPGLTWAKFPLLGHCQDLEACPHCVPPLGREQGLG